GIVLDLVLNHTSSQHPWFIQAKNDFMNDECDKEGSMCNWYNFSTEKKTGYTSLGNNKYYESVFWSEMPDLNLDELAVREEIEKIVKFWIDHGVSGFRLDAPYHYYNGNVTKNNEFLSWLEGVIKSYKEDAFLVGEVWSDSSTILKHYESGFDSFFNFTGSSTSGKIASSIRMKDGNSLSQWFVDYNQQMKSINEKAIDSVFLSNHDQGRSGAFFGNQIDKTKLMASVLLLAPGRVYIYYGEEIGMLGSGEDPNKRMPMLWSKDKEGMPFNPPGVTYTSQINTSVEEQLKDQASLLNYYKKVASIRNKSTLYEEGNIEVINVNNNSIYAMKFYKEDESLIVLHNFSDEIQILEINDKIDSYDSTNKNNKIKNNEITIQPLSSIVVYLEK
ncbi:MAG: alpha-amylase family glycosyl hydrolase, partial [Traorella sp.]